MKIEKEYKLMISKQDYLIILNYFKEKLNTIIQINYYYDTVPASVDKVIRIRKIHNRYFFTLKHKKGELYEYEFEISKKSLDDLRISDLLSKFDIKELVEIGSMKTTRHLLRDDYGEFCIDYSEYNGIADYEIEYELFNDQLDLEQHFNKWLKPFNLHYTHNAKNKVQRFKESLEKAEDNQVEPTTIL